MLIVKHLNLSNNVDHTTSVSRRNFHGKTCHVHGPAKGETHDPSSVMVSRTPGKFGPSRLFETTNQIIHGQSLVVRKKSCSSFALWLVSFHFVQMFFWIFWRRRFCDLFFSLGHFSLLFGANISHLHCASIFRGDKQFFRVTRFFHRVTRFFHLNMYIDIYTERRLRHNPVGCIGCE
jgi:hypothetical protein